MARGRHAIEAALDFARIPALARASVLPPIPADIVEVMRIAAASPKACQEAASVTGESSEALIEAARFYLQQSLFRPDADCHRILGLQPGATRAMARDHMRWLLEWLHPDRNDGLDAVYAERVVTAWREVSTSGLPEAQTFRSPKGAGGSRRRAEAFRVPWIKRPVKGPPIRSQSAYLTAVTRVIPGLLFLIFALWSAAYYFGLGPITAVVSLP